MKSANIGITVAILIESLCILSYSCKNDSSSTAKTADFSNADPLIVIAALRDADPKIRSEAAQALGKMNLIRAINPLSAALYDTIKEVRLSAAEALRNINDARIVNPLVIALQHEDAGMRAIAAQALGQIKDVRAIEPLSIAIKDKNQTVRKYATEALGKIDDTRTVKLLIDALKHEDLGVRGIAALYLGRKKDVRAIEPLRFALKYDDDLVREMAAWALGQIKDARVRKPLNIALKDTNQIVRQYAKEALKRIAAEEALMKIKKSETVDMQTTVKPEQIKPPPTDENVISGHNQVSIKNSNNFTITVELRGSCDKNVVIPAFGSKSVFVPDGLYTVYCETKNERYYSKSFSLVNEGISITIYQTVGESKLHRVPSVKDLLKPKN